MKVVVDDAAVYSNALLLLRINCNSAEESALADQMKFTFRDSLRRTKLRDAPVLLTAHLQDFIRKHLVDIF